MRAEGAEVAEIAVTGAEFVWELWWELRFVRELAGAGFVWELDSGLRRW